MYSNKIMDRIRTYSEKEEAANAVSHGIGILLGAIASFILLSSATKSGNSWAIISVIIYLFGMLSCYIVSTCYHACRDERRKALLRKLDHAAIYFHIAGTYTPFTLVVLREQGAWGWSLFSFIWLAAITGVFFSFKKLKKHSNIETVCYVVMGGSILIALKPLMDTLNMYGQISALFWLIGGGISYVIGALFYSWTGKKYMHTVFHIFVLGGSVCHIMAIYSIL